jgi:hypothetical protein
MFASLVIVFPTPHEGGELLLRCEEEWTFNSAKELSQQDQPCIGYVAFSSDVEQEIKLIKSGYQVTLTYNLYFGAQHRPPVVKHLPSSSEIAFKNALTDALANPGFLPKGGNLGFGLRYSYPVHDTIRHLIDCLKGSDAVIKKVCSELNLHCSLQVVYATGEGAALSDDIIDLSSDTIEDELIYCLQMSHHAVRLIDNDKDYIHWGMVRRVWWVTESTPFTTAPTSYLCYGNEPSLGHAYGEVSLIVTLIVTVGPHMNRAAIAMDYKTRMTQSNRVK